MPPPPTWKVVAVVGGIIGATAAVVVALWWAGTAGLNGDKLVTARLDALRTGLSIGIGGGGALALYLSWRRQRAAEITLAQAATALTQKDRDHDHTEADARERRITDLYTKAVEQLGSEKAPVRLGGIYALERLAQDNPTQRQTIVNVMCAYLRMPYDPPGQKPASGAEAALLATYREGLQEREVRRGVQRILAHHLRPGDDTEEPAVTFWPSINIDLANATLVGLDFSGVAIHEANFTNAQFRSYAYFDGADFGGIASFQGVRFTDESRFDRARFGDGAIFRDAVFAKEASFAGSSFCGDAYFMDAAFGGGVMFDSAKFDADVAFFGAQFTGSVWFDKARFGGMAGFDSEPFAGAVVYFGNVQFSGDAPEEVKPHLGLTVSVADFESDDVGGPDNSGELK